MEGRCLMKICSCCRKETNNKWRNHSICRDCRNVAKRMEGNPLRSTIRAKLIGLQIDLMRKRNAPKNVVMK